MWPVEPGGGGAPHAPEIGAQGWRLQPGCTLSKVPVQSSVGTLTAEEQLGDLGAMGLAETSCDRQQPGIFLTTTPQPPILLTRDRTTPGGLEDGCEVGQRPSEAWLPGTHRESLVKKRPVLHRGDHRRHSLAHSAENPRVYSHDCAGKRDSKDDRAPSPGGSTCPRVSGKH